MSLTLGSSTYCKQISLGGTSATQSIDLELGQGATQQVSMNDTSVRTLLGVTAPQSQISMSSGYGKGTKTLTTYTFPAGYSTWTAPCTTNKLETAIGRGGVATAGKWYSNSQIPFLYEGVYKYPTTASGVTGLLGSLDWSTLYNNIITDINGINALGTSIRKLGASSGTTFSPWKRIWYIWTNDGINTQNFTQYSSGVVTNATGWVRGTLSFYNPYSVPTSGPVLWSNLLTTTSYLYARGDFYQPGNRNDTTGMGLTFLGGDFYDTVTDNVDGTVGPAPSTTTTYSNIVITPGYSYGVYNYGSLTITYYA